MKKVNIFELKAKLSEYVDLVDHGETVVIYRRNHPVAELRRLAPRRTSERPVGGTALDVPPAFHEPLPAQVEDAFYPPGSPGRGAAPAAERPARPATGAPSRTRKR